MRDWGLGVLSAELGLMNYLLCPLRLPACSYAHHLGLLSGAGALDAAGVGGAFAALLISSLY